MQGPGQFLSFNSNSAPILLIFLIKGMFLYSTVSSPLDRCSFRHQLGFSSNHSSYAAITHSDYSLTFPPPSIARYSFFYTAGAVRREQKCPNFETVAFDGDSNPGSLDCDSGILLFFNSNSFSNRAVQIPAPFPPENLIS